MNNGGEGERNQGRWRQRVRDREQEKRKNNNQKKQIQKGGQKHREHTQEESTLSMKTESEKKEKQTKENGKAGGNSSLLTNADGHTNTHKNSANPLNHRKIAAKAADLQGIIWNRGRPGTQRANDGGIIQA